MAGAADRYVSDVEIRKLELTDYPAAYALSTEAFGPPPPGTPTPAPPTEPPPGRHTLCAFDGDRLVAKAVALELASWLGGAEIPTCGIAGVAVAAEHRGSGLLGDVLAPLLAESVARGEVVSTLYPTATGIYRSFGYELVTSYDCVEIPTADLARVRAAGATTTRRATPDDVPAMQAVYATWAAAQNGPLTRTGLRFTQSPEELLAEHTGVTLAVDPDDRVVGWAGWERSGGYGPHGVLEIWDLYGLTADAYRALWTVAASFTSVTGTVRLRTSGADPARLVLPTSAWASVARHQHPYMLRVSDVAGALGALAPRVPGLVAVVDVAVLGDRFGVTDGAYRLLLDDGPGRCESIAATPGLPTYSPQGLALAVNGAQSCANLRLLGHLTGPDDHDAVLDAALAGRPLHVRDYF
ncbi:GNAT family N-acetyltransferase [soil metagenome]